MESIYPFYILPHRTVLSYPDWAKTGIVGRGVPLDFYAYAQRHKLEYDPFSYYGVTVEELKAVQAEQGVEFQRGDILLIRSGASIYVLLMFQPH